jgi:short-subunit dehydrogenase
MAVQSMNLEGKAALVTGAGTGIGRGIALALARRGVRVTLVGRRHEPLAAVAAEVHALGGQAAVAPGDVAEAGARRQMLAAAHSAFGDLHILVNNAGVLASGALLQLNGAEIDRTVAVNLAAPIDLTRLALPDLMHTGGAIVFVGSTASHVPLPYASLYSGTKAGLHAFCASLRHELAPLGVHLLEAYPPTVATAMTARIARKAPVWLVRSQSAEAAGERIVAALAAGRKEVQWGAGERLLILLQRYAPHLLARGLGTQRRRLAHVMTREPILSMAECSWMYHLL